MQQLKKAPLEGVYLPKGTVKHGLFHKLALVAFALVAMVAISFVATGTVMADAGSYLPSSAAAGITQAQSDFTTVFGEAFAVLIVTTGSMFAWKWFGRLGKKA